MAYRTVLCREGENLETRRRFTGWHSPAWLAVLWVLILPSWSCSPAGEQSGDPSEASPAGEASGTVDLAEWTPPAELSSCAACHAVPNPEILPKSRWRPQLERMAALVEQYELGVPLTPEELHWAIDYYTSKAPVSLPSLAIEETPSPLSFVLAAFGNPPAPDDQGRFPIASHLEVADLEGDGTLEVLISDMLAGTISKVAPDPTGHLVETILADVGAPARSTVFDADGDGDSDIVVAALGSVGPTEEGVGQVVLLVRDGTEYRPQVLVDGLPRTSDVRGTDVDGDGDLDVVVASFGMFSTGGASWLENRGDQWVHHWIYRRNGVSHVPTLDLDGDGDFDILAMVSQEHEEIVALINDGKGTFEPHVVYKGPHPMFGMSNLLLADLDRDGDQDALFTNGDALDAEPYPKPWHGVQWLENLGGVKFRYHRIIDFNGAYSVAVGDLDGDEDLDLVATSMTNDWNDPARQSAIWLENDGAQNFQRHPLGNAPIALVASVIVDVDRDQRPDVLVGAMNVMPPFVRIGRVALWHNQGPGGPDEIE